MSSLIFESALRALALAIAAWAVLRLFRVRNVLALKCAWTVVLAASLAMPLLLLISAQLPAWPAATLRIPAISQHRAAAPVPAQAQAHTIPSPRTELSTARPAHHGRFHAPITSADYAAVAAPEQVPTIPRLTLSNLVWLVYFAVTGVFLVRLINGLASVLHLWRNAEPVSLAISRLAANLHLRSSSAISSPVSTWSGIVLPADYATWDEKKLRIVLAHERAHIRQGDFYLQLLAGLYQALVWFSPLGWWLKRKLSDLGEAVSDRAGLAEAASRFSYAQILLEFAVAPRTALIGVAMARPSSLSIRMDRLLNESAFHQAFAGGRRALLAALIAPIMLFAASAFVRVEAAPAKTQSTAAGQSHPDSAPILDSPIAQSTPQSSAQPASQPAPQPSSQPDTAPAMSYGATTSSSSDASATTVTNNSDGGHYSYSNDSSYAYSYADNGDAYALVLNNDDNIAFSGNWNASQREEIERARKSAGAGSFLWFRHDGKSYIVTDPATVQHIAEMYKPIQELGKQQEALGRQQEELGKQQDALGHAQEAVSVDFPEFSQEMAKLKTNLAALQEQINKQVTETTVETLQAKLAEVQARIGAIQGEIGAKQGELGAQQGKLGAEQGRLGAEQGRLGSQQGKLAREVDQQVKSIIDQSLKDGKAQPEK
jgi:beta-lactamase regulating signal transducer with metallopeptidase domain